MKITIDILDNELADVIRFTRAGNEREAVFIALADFNRRKRMAELCEHAGTCTDIVSPEELHCLRRKD